MLLGRQLPCLFFLAMPDSTPQPHLQGNERIVVTEGGHRVGDPVASVDEAQALANRRKQLAEAAGNPAPQVKVSQQIFG